MLKEMMESSSGQTLVELKYLFQRYCSIIRKTGVNL